MTYIFKNVILANRKKLCPFKIIMTIFVSFRVVFFLFWATSFFYTVNYTLRTLSNQGNINSSNMGGNLVKAWSPFLIFLEVQLSRNYSIGEQCYSKCSRKIDLRIKTFLYLKLWNKYFSDIINWSVLRMLPKLLDTMTKYPQLNGIASMVCIFSERQYDFAWYFW